MAISFLESVMVTLDNLSSRFNVKKVVYAFAVSFLIAVILLPPVLGITFKLGLVEQVFSNPELVNRSEAAIFYGRS